MIAGETEELGENLPQCHFAPPQIPHDQARFRTPDRSGGKPATNRLSYGAALSSVVGCGTILQAGMLRIRFPMRSLDFSIDLILPPALWH
jgi:hypothetical protein